MRPWLNWIKHQSTELVIAGSNPAGRTEIYSQIETFWFGSEVKAKLTTQPHC